MTMKQDVRKILYDIIPDELKKLYFQDEIAAKELFVAQIDSLCKCGYISRRTFNNACLSGNKKTGRLYIKCGSYTQEVK